MAISELHTVNSHPHLCSKNECEILQLINPASGYFVEGVSSLYGTKTVANHFCGYAAWLSAVCSVVLIALCQQIQGSKSSILAWETSLRWFQNLAGIIYIYIYAACARKVSVLQNLLLLEETFYGANINDYLEIPIQVRLWTILCGV